MARLSIDMYVSKETAETAKINSHRINIIKPHRWFNIGRWSIYPFDVKHDCPCLGFAICKGVEKVLFITDASYCKYKFSGITRLMIECNFAQDILDRNVEAGLVERALRKRVMESHFSLDRVKDLLTANDISKLQAVYLLHLSDSNSDEALFKREIQQITGVPVSVC